MAIMLAKTYNAFKAAGVPEAEAQAAAEELAGYDNRLGAVENRLAAVENHLDSLRAELNSFKAEVTGRLSVLTWAIGINAVLTVAILGVLLRH
jgi:hypothetical protein